MLLPIDAMGCQKTIAKHIVAKKSGYLLMVKGNPPKLRYYISSHALNIIFAENRKASLRLERKVAAWDDVVRENMPGILSMW